MSETKDFIADIKISEDVIASIAVLAATEVDGVASTQGNVTHDIASKIGVKNKTKGVTVRFMDNTSVDIELSIIMKYGCSIPKVCKIVQEKVKTSVESMAGLNVTNVTIKIIGVDTDNAR